MTGLFQGLGRAGAEPGSYGCDAVLLDEEADFLGGFQLGCAGLLLVGSGV